MKATSKSDSYLDALEKIAIALDIDEMSLPTFIDAIGVLETEKAHMLVEIEQHRKRILQIEEIHSPLFNYETEKASISLEEEVMLHLRDQAKNSSEQLKRKCTSIETEIGTIEVSFLL